ncbi:MAG: hypothetical protein Kow00117_00520 [Phototrophicales bacterium]
MILIIADYYLPGYKGGGPIRTIANTVEWLGDEFDFYILTGDRDFKDTEPYPDIRYGEWVTVGKAKVRYLSPKERGILSLSSIIQKLQPDLIYLNSFFAPMCVKTMWGRFLGRISRKIPVLIAPRNEFFAASLRLKRWKKRPYLYISRLLAIYHHITWQATTPFEQTTIAKQFNHANVYIACDLSTKELPQINVHHPKSDPIRLVYISRIDRKKNLIYALKLLKNIDSPVVFDIYGPREDLIYWQECETLIQSLPPHIHVCYQRELTHKEVLSTFQEYDAFLFPTQGENFGHIIWEALYAGCLPIISDNTPWDNVAGWTISLDNPQGFIAALHELIAMSQVEYTERQNRAHQEAIQQAHDPHTLEANRQMFQSLLQQKSKG